MKHSFNPIFLSILLISISSHLFSQKANEGIWEAIKSIENNQTIANSNLEIVNATYYNLDNVLMTTKLSQSTLSSISIIELPMPDGTFSRFSVTQVSMMEPALAAKYPNIKTYRGYGLDQPQARIRMDVSPRGFHAFILSSTDEIRIEPVKHGNNKLHVSYHTIDKVLLGNPSQCGFNEAEHTLDFNNNQPVLSQQSSSGSVGDQLRTYRIAISTRGDLAETKGWTTTAEVMTNVVSLLNEVNAIFERDLSITFSLVANSDLLFYLDSSTDPFTGPYLTENQTTIDAVIGDANYDIGHMLKPNSGGLAALPCVCSTGNKAKGYSSFDFLKTFCHEIGHQFNAGHSFNTETASCNGNRYSSDAYEPGSGSTIMSYSGSCTPNNVPNPGIETYFNAGAYDRISLYASGSGNCHTTSATGNSAPVVTVPASSFYIPISTPFTLTGSATDADGDPMDYSWEQYDLGPAGDINAPSGDAPIFRVFNPMSSPSRTFPQISDIINNTTTAGEILPSYSRNLNFRLMVRDNSAGHGGVDYGTVSFQADGTAGPFLVTAPNTAVSWLTGSTQTITWDVANTTNANVNSQNVNILLSADGGLTFPTTLLANTPNDGSQNVTIPLDQCGTTFRLKVESADNIFFDISNADFTIQSDLNNPSVDNVNTTAVDLTWSTTSATHFDIEYGALGFTQGTGTSINNINATSYNLTGLTASTEYDYYIRINPSGCWMGPISFLTLACTTESLPYSEDFENAGSFPACWFNLTSDDQNLSIHSGQTGTNNSGPSGAHSGTYYVYYEVSGIPANDQAILVGPQFDLTGANSPEVCFYYHMKGSAMGTLELQVESPVGSSNWTTVWSLTGEQQSSVNDDFIQACIDLTTYSGQTLRPRFRGTHLTNSAPWGDMAFDLVTLTPCSKPSNIIVSNTQETETDISWTSGGGTIWDMEYGTAGFSQGSGTMLNSINSSSNYNLSSLTSGTSYDIYIREHCSGNGYKSEWLGPFRFTTLQCTAVNLPYVEDFENGGSIAACWLQLTYDGIHDFVVQSGGTPSTNTGPSSAHSGTYYLHMEASNTGQGDQVQLLSPPINLASGSTYDLSFYYHMCGFSGEVGTLEVEVESPAGSGIWTSIWSISGIQQSSCSDPFLEATASIPGSGSARLRFTTTDGTGGQGDISFDLINITSALPISLIRFDGYLKDEMASQLNWETATEENNLGFEVQHSTNTRDWNTLTFIEGKGNSTIINDYDYLHTNPAVGVNYYRLKQLDFNGAYSFSDIVSVLVNKQHEIEFIAYPNPVHSGQLNIQILSNLNPQGQIKIYDTLGRKIMSKPINDQLETIDVNQLTRGLYMVEVLIGDYSTIQKIVVY